MLSTMLPWVESLNDWSSPEESTRTVLTVKAVKAAYDMPDEAARVTGQAYIAKRKVPPTMVILNPEGTIVGIARSFPTGRFLDWALFADKMPYAPIFGYIRQYDPNVTYIIRFADGHGMSDSVITIKAPSG